MKTNYKHILSSAVLGVAMLFGAHINAQDIHFTFANATMSNIGSIQFYEVDIMIQTINSTGNFKLSSGQLYFTYNTLAFGENVRANNKIEFTYPDGQGYIMAQGVDAAPTAKIYGVFTVNDNTVSRVSWACSQVFSSSTFAADNVTGTPTKLFHMKMEFTDSNELPMVMFEAGEVYDDQFFTACGPDTGGAFGSADCGASPGTQLPNDTFDSGGATLSINGVELANDQLSVYPNPTSRFLNISSTMDINKIVMYNILGKMILSQKQNQQIDLNSYKSGVYFLKIYSSKGMMTKKIIKN